MIKKLHQLIYKSRLSKIPEPIYSDEGGAGPQKSGDLWKIWIDLKSAILPFQGTNTSFILLFLSMNINNNTNV